MSKVHTPTQERPKREQPKPTEHAVFNDGKWFAWRINGVITPYRRRGFFEKKPDGSRGDYCIDFEPVGPVKDIDRPASMPPEKWQDLLGAVDFCNEGLT